MRRSIVFFVICAFFMVALQSCGGGGGGDPAPTGGTGGTGTNSDLLKTWKVSQVLEGSLDITSAFTAYQITFNESGNTFTLVSRQGTTLEGTWALASDETSMTLTFSDGSVLNLTGVSISSSQLKYTTNEQGKTGLVQVAFTLVPA